MTQLGFWMIGTGTVFGAAALLLLAAPAAMTRALVAFPRNVWVGRGLAAVALGWSAWLAWDMPMGFVDAYKQWLYVLTPVVYLLVVWLMEDMLAARAFGGLLLLVAEPVLSAARQPGLPAWRLTMVVLVYAWIVAGMALVLGPYWFRKTVEPLCRSGDRCRKMGAVGLAIGILLAALGSTVLAR